MASVAGAVKSDCPQAQLDRVHAHWHTLIVEPDPAVRAQRILEHRELVDSVREVAKAGASGASAGCNQEGTPPFHDLENTLDMHSMMLDMIE